MTGTVAVGYYSRGSTDLINDFNDKKNKLTMIRFFRRFIGTSFSPRSRPLLSPSPAQAPSLFFSLSVLRTLSNIYTLPRMIMIMIGIVIVKTILSTCSLIEINPHFYITSPGTLSTRLVRVLPPPPRPPPKIETEAGEGEEGKEGGGGGEGGRGGEGEEGEEGEEEGDVQAKPMPMTSKPPLKTASNQNGAEG